MNPIARNTAAALATLVAVSFAPTAQAAGEWEWVVAPYLWAPTISTDLETNVPPDGGVSNENDFGNVLDKMDGAFEIHIEGQGDQFGLFADFTFLGLADEKEYARFDSESDLDARLFDAAAVWSPGAGAYGGWEVYGGLRYIDVDATVRLDPVNPAFGNTTIDAGDSFSDFLVGARYSWKVGERWGFTLRGDASFGDTEGTWLASAMGSYRTGNGAWYFGYRHMTGEFETRAASTELSLSGPLFGYGFRF